MTPGARRILEELAADEHRDLIREGIHAYCGSRPVASRCISELVWSAAIHEVAPSAGPGARYYAISEMGRRYLRRPELEREYLDHVRLRKGSFTVKADRIVLLTDVHAAKLTPVQRRVLSTLAAGQSVVERSEWRVAVRLEDRGLITNGRCSVAFNKTFTYYELTPAGTAALTDVQHKGQGR